MKYKNYEILGLDFETYWDTKFSLSKIDTPMYVHDERFWIHGVGVRYAGVSHYLRFDELAEFFGVVDWENTALLCHNTAFDGYILTQIFNVTPAYYMDTLSMARPVLQNNMKSLGLDSIAKHLGYEGKVSSILANTKGKYILSDEEDKEMETYCLQDVNEMFRIYETLKPEIPEFEMDLIDITIRMFCEPKFVADLDRIQQEIQRIKDEKNDIFHQVEALLPPQTDESVITILRSSDKYAELLRYNGITPPVKTSPTTGEETYAFAKTDIGFQKLDTIGNPRAKLLRRARLISKSDNALTKAQKLYDYASHGAIPAYLNYAKAQTLRWSGKEIQLQNMGRGGEMRRSLCAPPGHVIVVIDSGQIEARMTAWLAEQEELLQLFREDKDVYKDMASKIYQVPYDQVNKEQRFIGKIAILGLGYSMSANKFHLVLKQGVMGPPVDLPISDCNKVVRTYRTVNNKIADLWNKGHLWLHGMASNTKYTAPDYKGLSFKTDKLYSHKGMYMNYNDLTVDNNEFTYMGANQLRRKIYGALLVENVVQHMARNLIAEQTLNVAKRYPVLLSVHDEVVYLAPENEAEEAYQYGLDCFLTPADWCPDIPLAAEGGYANNYSK